MGIGLPKSIRLPPGNIRIELSVLEVLINTHFFEHVLKGTFLCSKNQMEKSNQTIDQTIFGTGIVDVYIPKDEAEAKIIQDKTRAVSDAGEVVSGSCVYQPAMTVA